MKNASPKATRDRCSSDYIVRKALARDSWGFIVTFPYRKSGLHDTSAPPSDDRHLDRGVARRQAFLVAARAVFLEQGYEAASVNDVVRRAGGSLATLYAQFGSKEGLFLAVSQDQHERFVADVTPKVSVDTLDLAEGLQTHGETWLRAILAPDHLAFYRIFIGEGRKFPQLLQRFLTSGGERTRAIVATYLQAWAARTGAEIQDADRLAGYFFDLVRSRLHYRSLADSSYVATQDEIRDQVREATAFFIKGLTCD